MKDDLGEKGLCGNGGADGGWHCNSAKRLLEHILSPNPGYKVAGFKEGANGTKYASFEKV